MINFSDATTIVKWGGESRRLEKNNESRCNVHFKTIQRPKQQPLTQMNRKNLKQGIALVSNSKISVMRKIRCSGCDSMSFVTVAAVPKIGALAIEPSQPVDSATN
jgi:hypothetical protein